MRWVGHVACMGQERKVYKVLVGKPKGKRPLGRPRHRREGGIRMNPLKIGWGGVDLIQPVMNLAPNSYYFIKTI
jgi:hypothetical protein